MKLSPRHAVALVLVPALLVVVALNWAAAFRPAPTPDSLAAFRPCAAAPALGPGMVVCANLHSYHRQDGRWIDLGRVTSLPRVPRD